jgi:hypothetical protein
MTYPVDNANPSMMGGKILNHWINMVRRQQKERVFRHIELDFDDREFWVDLV